MRESILFVDDEQNVLMGLRRLLHEYREKWDLHFVDAASIAMERLRDISVDCIITDVDMPELSGFDLLQSVREDPRTRGIPVIILTGRGDRELKRKALDLGAADLLGKPVELEDLIARIKSALRDKAHHDQLQGLNSELERRVDEKTKALQRSHLEIIWRLAKAGEYRSEETGNHVLRVGCYSRLLAERLGLSQSFVDLIFATSPLHDIGKIGIPDRILLKPGPLTPDERQIMERHSVIGAQILLEEPRGMGAYLEWGGEALRENGGAGENQCIRMASSIALTHHERWDGSGYPLRKRGESIPLESRIVTLADLYDSLRSDRPYKSAYPEEKCLAIIREEVGKHLDPNVFAAFEGVIDDFRAIRERFPDQPSRGEAVSQAVSPEITSRPGAKRRVMFVDDDSNVLSGLRRMLRPLRGEWDMEFMDSGQSALERLATEPCDVVVADMRMPGMSGDQLLNEVMRRHPQAVRIILSGQSDKDSVLRSVGPTHQFIAKPCEAKALRAAISRACGLRDLLETESLKRVISRMESLPSLPSLYVEIMEEINSPEASIQAVGEIIGRDIGMTAKVLQLVNSAFFGLPRHVSSPAQAAGLLGLDIVKALVLTIQVFSQFDVKRLPHFSMDRLWDHSLRTGGFAKAIAKSEGRENGMVEDAYMAGLLHDIGKLILAANLPDLFDEAQRKGAESTGIRPHWAVEREICGASHAEVGAYLMGLWGLPDPIVEALAYHHAPGKWHSHEFSPLVAVHCANALDHADQSGDEACGGLDTSMLTELGLAGRIEEWRRICMSAGQKDESHE